MRIDFKYLEDNSYASVTDYCRVLVKNKNYDKTLEVYRGEMLCLTVDVEKAAKLEPTDTGWTLYRAPEVRRRGKRLPKPVGALF